MGQRRFSEVIWIWVMMLVGTVLAILPSLAFG